MDEQPHGVREAWETFWARGIADPLTALEQMAFLVLLRYVDLVDARSAASGRAFVSIYTGRPQCRWAELMAMPPEQAVDVMQQAVPELLSQLADHPDTAATMRELRLTLTDPALVRAAMAPLDRLTLDDVGPFYDQLLEGLGRDGRTGPLRTPSGVARAIVQLAGVQPGDIVVDPGAGLAQLLLEAHRTVHDARLLGWESDVRMARIGAVNLFVHGVELRDIELHATPLHAFERASVNVMMSAPRFGTGPARTPPLAIELGLESNRTEVLLVELARQILRPGGRGVVVVPEGLLFAGSRGHVELRRRLVELAALRAVISLPEGVFRPFTSVNTAILVFEPAPARTDEVLFFEVGAAGQGASGVASEEDLDELPGLLAAHRADTAGWRDPLSPARREQAWTATAAQIVAHDYDLAPQAYRPAPAADAEHPDPAELFAQVTELERRFDDRLATLAAVLGARS